MCLNFVDNLVPNVPLVANVSSIITLTNGKKEID